MTVTLTAIWTREEASTLWPFEAGAYKTAEQLAAGIAYVQETYIDTGLCLSKTVTPGPTELTCVKTHIFKDQLAYFQFMNDGDFWDGHLAGRQQYMAENGITVTTEVS